MKPDYQCSNCRKDEPVTNPNQDRLLKAMRRAYAVWDNLRAAEKAFVAAWEKCTYDERKEILKIEGQSADTRDTSAREFFYDLGA